MSVTKRLAMAGVAALAVLALTGDAYHRVTLAYSAGRLAMDGLAEMNATSNQEDK
jgi:hypothetical protein